MHKKAMLFFLTSIVSFSHLTPGISYRPSRHTPHTTANTSVVSYIPTTRAPIREWRYRAFDYRLYRRLYNHTTGRFEGPWLRV